MEAICSSERPVDFQRATLRNFPEDRIFLCDIISCLLARDDVGILCRRFGEIYCLSFLFTFSYRTQMRRARDSSVGIATGCGQNGRGVGVRVPVGSGIFSPPPRPDRLWGPPSLLSDMYHGLLPRGLSGRGVKLTTHLHLLPKLRMMELYLHCPIR
jgi:hypothetical protein